MLYRRETGGGSDAIVGLLLIGIMLAGVSVCANVFSFLMMICLGVPGLLLLLDSLLIDRHA